MTKHQKHLKSRYKNGEKVIEICQESDLPEPPPKYYWLRSGNIFQSFFNQWTPKYILRLGEW